jgi:hypothetical protein
MTSWAASRDSSGQSAICRDAALVVMMAFLGGWVILQARHGRSWPARESRSGM